MTFKETGFNSVNTLWLHFNFCIRTFFWNGCVYHSMHLLLADGRVANEELTAQRREQVTITEQLDHPVCHHKG